MAMLAGMTGARPVSAANTSYAEKFYRGMCWEVVDDASSTVCLLITIRIEQGYSTQVGHGWGSGARLF